MSEYYVMDSRAVYDTDRAVVLECLSATTLKGAKRQAKESWAGQSACICTPDKDRVLEYVCGVDDE